MLGGKQGEREGERCENTAAALTAQFNELSMLVVVLVLYLQLRRCLDKEYFPDLPSHMAFHVGDCAWKTHHSTHVQPL